MNKICYTVAAKRPDYTTWYMYTTYNKI